MRSQAEPAVVEQKYDRLARFYDLAYGPILQPGRLRAMQVMAPAAGSHVLEVGVGTGLNLSLYPDACAVTGIDCSPQMLERAGERAAREGRRARLFRMDATDLRFADGAFDFVYAPYLISVVPDPVAVLREMYRVCRPGGRLVVLNHFRSEHPLLSVCERLVSPLTIHIGFQADVDREAVFGRAGLKPEHLERVNLLWTLAVVRKAAG